MFILPEALEKTLATFRTVHFIAAGFFPVWWQDNLLGKKQTATHTYDYMSSQFDTINNIHNKK